MHTVERSLEEEYRGRSFVILGVNCDPDRETMRTGQSRDHAAWRSIHDVNSVNMERWQIQRTPTVVLIDARGVIRYRSPTTPTQKMLEQQINHLLEEAASADGKRAGCPGPFNPLG